LCGAPSTWRRDDEGRPALIDAALTIAIVDESRSRAAIIEEGLREAGYRRIVHIDEMTNLLARLYATDPDVVVIDLENPSRDVLEQLFQVSKLVRRPVAMFVDQSDTRMINAAIEAGVSAYVVDGLKKERVRGILDMCIARFRAYARLQDELDHAKSQLEERKIVERAKGLLMKHKGISEDEAYALMRKRAMNEKKKIGEIASAVVTGLEMLG
jgi:two-component system, response regulator / RNA-binding antiterminator